LLEMISGANLMVALDILKKTPLYLSGFMKNMMIHFCCMCCCCTQPPG
jgi:hypothetical protein